MGNMLIWQKKKLAGKMVQTTQAPATMTMTNDLL